MKEKTIDNDSTSLRQETVSALERGIAVMRCFTEDRRSLTSTELSRLTGVPRPTVTRLASTLVALGLMQQEPRGDRFMLGPGVVSLARVFLAGMDVRAVARPHMQALANAVEGSVFLGVPDGLDMVVIEACRPRTTMLTQRLEVGSRAPIANSALGRAYLWALSRDERHALIETLRLARGADWVGLEPALNAALADAERLRYCMSAGEFHREINTVSVPIVTPEGQIVALSCGAAAFSYIETRLRDVVAPHLLRTAEALAADLGGLLAKSH